MNKYHSSTLMLYLEHFAEFIKDSIENLRSGISKDALMLTTELFGNQNAMKDPQFQETIIRFIEITMPSIIFKTVYEKAFIAKEAQTSVQNALNTCRYDELLNILIEAGCKGIKIKLQENSYNYCSIFVKNADK